MDRKKCTAIVLSAGKGKRMGTDVAKQYLDLNGRPVLYYSLKAFQDSFIDDIIIVASPEDHSYIWDELVNKYGLSKVSAVVMGGKERYDSVLCGLRAAGSSGPEEDDDCGYVFIHDGARPFIDNEMLTRSYETAVKFGCAITAMPVKDTVKIVDEDGVAIETPDRRSVWQMQTPQVFEYKEILKAYESMIKNEDALIKEGIRITDDAMVMERFGSLKVHVSTGSYRNIKITTPEDMVIADAFINNI